MTLVIADESDLTLILMESGRLADEIGFNHLDRSAILTAVAELGRNILKYAVRGSVTLKSVSDAGNQGMEIVAKDCGPGIENIESAMGDHFSTGGTLGLGLPGVRRIMDEFNIQSEQGSGTIITTRKWIL